MRLFLVSQLNISEKKFLTKEQLKYFMELKADYDFVIGGSDQIWSINSIRGFDTSYFLDFDNNKFRKLSYAASFGRTDSLGENCNSISRLISDFDNISVRDSNSLNLIQQDCGISGIKVLDPTFLIDYKKSFDLSKKPSKKKYLLLYLEKYISPEEINFIKFVAQKRNLIIISIGEPGYLANKKLVNISPVEWLTYFNHASYIVTNFYHGTIFSLKFKKQFTTLGRKSKLNKIGDLLNDLNLSNRFVNNIEANSFEEQLVKINYDVIGKKLEKEILKSKTYLFDALNQNKDEDASITMIEKG